MERIVLVSGCRSAVGSMGGSLKGLTASDLGGIVVKEALRRAGVSPEAVDEVVLGCVGQWGEDAFVARLSSVKAGIPYAAGAVTVNRLCASGLQAIVTAAQELRAGFCSVAVAGGTESMSNLPYYVRNARFGYRMGDGVFEDGLVLAVTDPFSHKHMGITAENVAEQYGITREMQDRLALISQQRAAAARAGGLFKEQIVPIEVRAGKRETKLFAEDEHIRGNTTLEKLAGLRPAFKEGGTVTAGNASGVNDGAAAVVLMKEGRAKELGVKPLLRFVDAAVAGVDPSVMGIGPIGAVRKLLAKTGVSLDEIGLIELNEAFAAQAAACIRELGLKEEIVNVNGSGISIGHPIGATGCILTVKLMYEMRRRGARYGLATLCIGGGQGLAVLYELCA